MRRGQTDPATTGRTRLSRPERRSLIGMGTTVLALHLVGWGVLIGVVVPSHYALDDARVFGVGIGLTAYTLGMRHAFDVDHIAAIDNTTRQLLHRPQRPLSVGFWFSLGHSSVVFGLVTLLALGVRAVAGQLADDSSLLQRLSGVVGTAVSGAFLLLIGLLNLGVLVGIVRVARQLRHGALDEAELEAQLRRRGLFSRVLATATRAIRRPVQMYPVGLLFGLGFDTATEVGLLVLAGGAAAFSLPWYAVLTLPVLFAAGMSLLDTADGCFMSLAYGWAFNRPVRKVYYNLTITTLSVAVALAIGSLEIASLLARRAGADHGPVAALARLDLHQLGYAVVGLFVLTFGVALLVWRVGRIEERWGGMSTPPG
ncbi:MAG: nixA [Friedmanniella sp.]|nr:nixA [Friedmanniella sp.]